MKKVNITIALLSLFFVIAAVLGYPKESRGPQGENLILFYWIICIVELLVLVLLWMVLRYRHKKRQEQLNESKYKKQNQG